VDEIRIPYKPNIIVFLFVIVFFGICGATLFYVAKTNDRGLVINHLIELSATGASYFYGVLALASSLFVLLGIIVIGRGITSKREVIVGASAISAPKSGISQRMVTVAFGDISSMNVQKVQRTRILNINYNGGRLSIPNNMVPGKTGFDDLVKLISERLKQTAVT